MPKTTGILPAGLLLVLVHQVLMLWAREGGASDGISGSGQGRSGAQKKEKASRVELGLGVWL